MAIHPDLLEMLVCPACKQTLSMVDDGQGLKCSACLRIYPIRDDIPVMLVSEARTED